MEFEYYGRKVNCQIVEEGKGYKTVLVHFELPGTQHFGFLVRKGDVIIPKGEIAKAIRDRNIDGVEMAVAPPSESNALFMMRITDDIGKVLDRVIPIVYEYLKDKGFI